MAGFVRYFGTNLTWKRQPVKVIQLIAGLSHVVNSEGGPRSLSVNSPLDYKETKKENIYSFIYCV